MSLCMICGASIDGEFRYCSEECLVDAVDWGVWHPVIRGEVRRVSYPTKQIALEKSGSEDAVQRKDCWKKLREEP